MCDRRLCGWVGVLLCVHASVQACMHAFASFSLLSLCSLRPRHHPALSPLRLYILRHCLKHAFFVPKVEGLQASDAKIAGNAITRPDGSNEEVAKWLDHLPCRTDPLGWIEDEDKLRRIHAPKVRTRGS